MAVKQNAMAVGTAKDRPSFFKRGLQVPAEFFLPLPDDLQAAFEGRNP